MKSKISSEAVDHFMNRIEGPDDYRVLRVPEASHFEAVQIGKAIIKRLIEESVNIDDPRSEPDKLESQWVTLCGDTPTTPRYEANYEYETFAGALIPVKTDSPLANGTRRTVTVVTVERPPIIQYRDFSDVLHKPRQ